jgi:hypothetical protein
MKIKEIIADYEAATSKEEEKPEIKIPDELFNNMKIYIKFHPLINKIDSKIINHVLKK